MYEKFKSYIDRYDWVFYLIMAGIACAICWIIYGGGNDSDYQRAIDDLERAKEQQRESLDINKDVKNSVERSASLNREASERITRIEVYQHQAITRIDESAKRLDEAEERLARNEQLIRDIEQRHQTKSPNGTATAQTAQHVGGD